MRKKEIDIEIDRLTNSIENSVTGEVFDTNVVRLGKSDKKKLGATQFKGQRMYIETVNTLKLVKKYFQD